jgi:hypothetical protein
MPGATPFTIGAAAIAAGDLAPTGLSDARCEQMAGLVPEQRFDVMDHWATHDPCFVARV